MKTITKLDIIYKVEVDTDYDQKVIIDITRRLIAVIVQALEQGHRIELRGLGSFEPAIRPARRARNPQTGAAVDVPARRTVRYKPGKLLRGAFLGSPGRSIQ